MEARNVTLSPQGFEYRYDPNAPAGQRLARRAKPTESWVTFSIHYMSAEELRFVADVIDEVRNELPKST